MNQTETSDKSKTSEIKSTATLPSWNPLKADGSPKYEMIGKKPVLYVTSVTILNDKSTKFQHKLLCDGLTLNAGDTCVFTCTFCYAPKAMIKLHKQRLEEFNSETGLKFRLEDVVIRRFAPLNILRSQLFRSDGRRKYHDPDDQRVVYMATLVDVAATMEILRETAEICKLILENTNWQIRLLSKSSLLKLLVTKNMIATEYHHRLIMGFSTGTLDDRLAASIEKGTSPVSKRIKALHELQDLGIRTFGMICPSLPYASQEDYDSFSRAMCEALRIDRCEHVWAEVINVRGHSLVDTVKALRDGGYTAEAERVEAVSGTGKAERWEEYARMTFEAHKKHVPADKLRFLQYLGKGPADYWSEERGAGVVLLGKEAVKNNLLSFESSGEIVPFPALEKEDVQYHAERVDIVSRALNSAFLAARALFEIKTYKDGILWKIESKTFEEYCARQWKYQKSQAYRLLGLGRFLSKFPEKDSPFGEDSPVRESHLRPVLEKVPEEHQMACWESFGETASAGKVTAASVRSHVEEYLAKKGLDVSADLTPERWWRDRARARVKLLEADFAKLGFAKESARLLEQLVALIDGAQVAAGADGTNLNDPRG